MNRNTEGQVKEIRIFPIGYIRSPYQKGQAVPAQGDLRDGQTARIFLLPQYKEGIADLKAGDYGVILFHFHYAEQKGLTVFSCKFQRPMGVFSTRSPHRPNAIGMTIVQFIRIVGCELEFRGGDMLDGTPVLDIKPWEPGGFPPAKDLNNDEKGSN